MEGRTVALDFRCDESRNLPDMRRSSMIFVNVHVHGTRSDTCSGSTGRVLDNQMRRKRAACKDRFLIGS